MTLEGLIARFGLSAVFLGAGLEGDVTMILAGVAAHVGLLGFPEAVGAGILGGFASDLAWYGVGRWHAGPLRASELYRRAGPTIERFARRLGVWQIAAARYVYGTRIASMCFWGLHGLPLWRFAVVDLAGCVSWGLVLGGLGFVASDSVAAVVGRVRRVELWLLIALVLAALVLVVLHRLVLRRTAREQR
jgi:membrane protein DedA with SNARE-associated domain